MPLNRRLCRHDKRVQRRVFLRVPVHWLRRNLDLRLSQGLLPNDRQPDSVPDPLHRSCHRLLLLHADPERPLLRVTVLQQRCSERLIDRPHACVVGGHRCHALPPGTLVEGAADDAPHSLQRNESGLHRGRRDSRHFERVLRPVDGAHRHLRLLRHQCFLWGCVDGVMCSLPPLRKTGCRKAGKERLLCSGVWDASGSVSADYPVSF